MVALRQQRNGDWRSLRLSAPGECRVPRIVTRIRGCVVEAGRESSAVNESGGPGSLLGDDCLLILRVVKRRRSTCGTSS